MKNTCLFYSVFQVLKVLLNKKLELELPVLLFLVFTSVFTSADIIYQNFLELDSKLSKKDLCHELPF